MYQFYLNVLEGAAEKETSQINLWRAKLRKDVREIEVEDFGTVKSAKRKIADLEKNVAVKEKYGLLLFRLVKYFHPKNILELGTNIGISSSYMARANPSAKIISLEGSENLIEEAKKNHVSLNISNTEFVCGNFDETLPTSIQELLAIDLVLFDGNHTKDATLKYFELCLPHADENSIFIFDDIYYSVEMTQAWSVIKQHSQITLTLDVYQFGICFFRKEKLAKENFVLRY
ncbi:MAG: class I SAM-dependent methyltransferase [Bacteroidetes bacterium]|nr:class I SAM-dependent methyltransferase [Bacteroidota bacterium]